MKHPRRASRDPLKGAAPAAWRSQFRGTPGVRHFAPDAPLLSVCRLRCPVSGMLRVGAVSKRVSLAGRSRGRLL